MKAHKWPCDGGLGQFGKVFGEEKGVLVAVWGLVPQQAGPVPLGKYSGVFATILARFSLFWNSIGGSQTERLSPQPRMV